MQTGRVVVVVVSWVAAALACTPTTAVNDCKGVRLSCTASSSSCDGLMFLSMMRAGSAPVGCWEVVKG